MRSLTRTSALRGVLLHIACIVCMTGAVPVPVLDPLTGAPTILESDSVDSERQYKDWTPVALGLPAYDSQSDEVAAEDPSPEANYDTPRGVTTPKTPRSDIVEPEHQSVHDLSGVAQSPAQVPGQCRQCEEGSLRITDLEKEAEVQRTMCSSDFAIGGRAVGGNRTHYRMKVFGVFKSGPKPIYGMMSYGNPRSSSLRPPAASSSSSSMANSTSSQGMQPGESGAHDKLEPPREFVIRLDVTAPQCQPCAMRLGRNYFVAGLVRDGAFLLSADSTVFRWKRKVRKFIETAVAAEDDC